MEITELTEQSFINMFAKGSITLDPVTLEMPQSIYKLNGELNAEKVMMLVLKARAERKKFPGNQAKKEISQFPGQVE